MQQSTVGFKLLCLLKDRSEQWFPLKYLKESNPVECAEYAKARRIDTEHAFRWLVPYTLNKMERIIAMIKSRLKANLHKYGIEVPRDLAHAEQLDTENGNQLWQDTHNNEMFNVSVAFEILENGKSAPVGLTKTSGHLIWDLKMDFTRKARWVKDRHCTPDPKQSNYTGVVVRDSIWIALTCAALNELAVTASDVYNAYLQTPLSKKHYIVFNDDFGIENRGNVALIRRALYGGKWLDTTIGYTCVHA